MEQYGYNQEYHNAYIQCFEPSELKRIKSELKSHLRRVQLIGENSWESSEIDFDKMRTKDGLNEISTYADGIGPWIPHVLKTKEPATRMTGKDWPFPGKSKIEPTSLVEQAHECELFVHVYTFRADALPNKTHFVCKSGLECEASRSRRTVYGLPRSNKANRGFQRFELWFRNTVEVFVGPNKHLP